MTTLDDHQPVAPRGAPVIDEPAPGLPTEAVLALERAVDRCVMANHALEEMLGRHPPPHTAATPVALTHYGPGQQFELWLAWRGIVRLREAFDTWLAETRPTPGTGRKGTIG